MCPSSCKQADTVLHITHELTKLLSGTIPEMNNTEASQTEGSEVQLKFAYFEVLYMTV